ncbi:MAG: type sorting protein [Bacteroidetes bacterium]|nr:type sorting protein [Bacteroidota bacterium]
MKTKFIFFFFLVSVAANAQYTKLLDFTGISTGSNPKTDLFFDGTFLYGTALHGGTGNFGTIFKIKPDGSLFTRLFDFDSTTTGATPFGPLISDGVFLYGTTSFIGNADNYGTIFKILPDGTGYTRLHTFDSILTGNNPLAPLVLVGGVLYGTTSAGGINSAGILFKVNTDGTGYANVFDFDVLNGAGPGSLIYDGTYFYGLTFGGGAYNNGEIFKIKPDGTGSLNLFDFNDTVSGTGAYGSLIYDGTFLYGMNSFGGAHNDGTIFKIKTDGTNYSKLLDFAGASNGRFAEGSLFYDGTFLYGMTAVGGANDKGVLFKIKPDGTGFADMMDFDGHTSGNFACGSLISDGTNLYGMTELGGTDSLGTIFKFQINAFSGIEENNAAEKGRIYPNPFTSETTIYPDAMLRNATLTVFNALGQLVKETKNISGQTITIQREILQPGLYFVQVLEGNSVLVRKKVIISNY